MSKVPVLLLLAALGTQALAATPVTVQQVDQLLAAKHKQRDTKLAKGLSDLELTERVSSAVLSKWEAECPGEYTREALMALADSSAFLDLPPAEIPPIAMPDAAEREQILNRTIEYVRTAIHLLPNFIATRSTTHFDDMPLNLSKRLHKQSAGFDSALIPLDEQVSYKPRPLHAVNRAAIVVTYHNGLEVMDAGAGKGNEPFVQQIGLTSSGEFGPILSTVVGDAIRGQIFWSHWEQGADGPLAVLRYVVPHNISHYAVSVGKIGEADEPEYPAYHGEIAVDPTTGAILRLTMESEVTPPHESFKSGILVEYGPVTIGERIYICPIRSEALSKLSAFGTDDNSKSAITRYLTYLNDVSFSNYHLFRAEVRILP